MKKKYVKRPLIIEAEQWFPWQPVEGVSNKLKNLDIDMTVDSYIDTLEGRMKVKPGDYIITGIKGERYCCDAIIFEESYDELKK
jgi:hypothetical protein